MKKSTVRTGTIEAYIADFPPPVRVILQKVRGIVRKAAPEAEETIKYGIPTFVFDGNLVHFAACDRHLGFYPTPSGIKHFQKELSAYKHAKGSVQFPLDAPIPYKLITKIVKFRVQENLNKQQSKPTRTKAVKKSTKRNRMQPDTAKYNKALDPAESKICDLLASEIDKHLPEAENKIWHGHPVWFLDGNPVVGYSKLKNCVRLLFWSGQSFDEAGLANEGSFKAAEARYTAADQVKKTDLKRWLSKAREIQWDYKNIVKRKGKLERLK